MKKLNANCISSSCLQALFQATIWNLTIGKQIPAKYRL